MPAVARAVTQLPDVSGIDLLAYGLPLQDREQVAGRTLKFSFLNLTILFARKGDY